MYLSVKTCVKTLIKTGALDSVSLMTNSLLCILKMDLSNFLYYKHFEISLPQTFYQHIKQQSHWHSNILQVYQNQIDFSWGILYTRCAPKVLNSRICLLSYAFSTCFKEGKLHGFPSKMCCLAGQVQVCNLHLGTILRRQCSLLCSREGCLWTVGRLRFMQCPVLVSCFVFMTFPKDVSGRCVGLPCSHPTHRKLRLCQEMAEGYFRLHKSGSSPAEACVYPQTLHASV